MLRMHQLLYSQPRQTSNIPTAAVHSGNLAEVVVGHLLPSLLHGSPTTSTKKRTSVFADSSKPLYALLVSENAASSLWQAHDTESDVPDVRCNATGMQVCDIAAIVMHYASSYCLKAA